jgi:hypothetical protein
MLLDAVDVGGRVFAGRGNSPLLLNELPACMITFAGEDNKMIVGSEFKVKEYQRDLNLVVTLVAEENISDEINTSNTAEDKLDYLAEQVERAFFDDWRLSKRLPQSADLHDGEGLSFGHRITSVASYDVDTEGDRRVVALDIRILIPYNSAGYSKAKLKDWLDYKADIVRVGSNEHTVDRVLLGAEGKMR